MEIRINIPNHFVPPEHLNSVNEYIFSVLKERHEENLIECPACIGRTYTEADYNEETNKILLNKNKKYKSFSNAAEMLKHLECSDPNDI